MGESVRRRYEAMAGSGALQPDPGQRALADALDALIVALGERARTSKRSALGWLFSRGQKPEPPRGLYIWGGVGAGKTLLMDIFFDAAAGSAKRRVHFHEFMGEVHDRIAAFRRKLASGETTGDDPIAPVAAEISMETQLLCFDEFAVSDIADAMILGRLFERLFAQGVVVVPTSNVAPGDLYKDGLNRALFLPFIELIEERMSVFHLTAQKDYRLEASASQRRYVTPLGPEAARCLSAQFRRLAGRERGEREEIVYRGRRIVVPEAAAGVARFSFAELCGRPLGAGDYLKLAGSYHTFIVADVPVFDPANRNEAKRFINLIDTLYDNGIRLVVSAASDPEGLGAALEGQERFEFARTASRLVEMQSDAYWAAAEERGADTKTARAV